ncbi:MAG TPA: hypothetical protein VMF62_11315 [Acetobacteraceae bacterium]|jgi:hypothetical protein|nr:hypothetical protein [Acetobacteraceae bacterium]
MERFAWAAVATCLAGLPVLSPRAALAQGEGIRLVASGDWVATEQRDSSGGPADICSAFTKAVGSGNGEQTFGLQANIIETEVRFSDIRWSLPANVGGTLALAVGDYRTTLKISDNTNDMAIAAITAGSLRAMIGAMEKADAMTVTIGADAPLTVSLKGSNRATDAFRACAGRIGGAGKGGNPFH